MEKKFERFSEDKKRKMREMRKDPQELKFAAIEKMLLLSAEVELNKEVAEEIKRKLELAGLNPQMIEFRAPKTKDEKIAYGIPFNVKNLERKILESKFQELKKIIEFEIPKKKRLKNIINFSPSGN